MGQSQGNNWATMVVSVKVQAFLHQFLFPVVIFQIFSFGTSWLLVHFLQSSWFNDGLSALGWALAGSVLEVRKKHYLVKIKSGSGLSFALDLVWALDYEVPKLFYGYECPD